MSLPVKWPHQVTTIALELFLLLIHSKKTDQDVKSLRASFLALLPVWKFEDITNIQANYAIRIADEKGQLEYEEMHKIFSLCDEIHALEIYRNQKEPVFLFALFDSKNRKVVHLNQISDKG